MMQMQLLDNDLEELYQLIVGKVVKVEVRRGNRHGLASEKYVSEAGWIISKQLVYAGCNYLSHVSGWIGVVPGRG